LSITICPARMDAPIQSFRGEVGAPVIMGAFAAVVSIIAARGIVVVIVWPPAPAILEPRTTGTENMFRVVDGSHCGPQVRCAPKGYGLGMGAE
jgi:hypothetical protein